MSRRIASIGFAAALGLLVTVGLSGVAKAGTTHECGNGEVEDPPEKCDDGNTVTEPADQEGCSFPSCLPSGPNACGDGITNADIGEECDDGNTNDTDACDNNCKSTGPLEKPAQKCINAMNANGAGVLNAQNKDTAKCLKNSAKGSTTFATCFGTDVAGKVAKAGMKTTKTFTKKCDPAPTSFFTDDATVNAAAKAGSVDATTTILGDPATISPKTEKDNSKCQAEVLKQLAKIQSTWAKEANKAKKSALKVGTDVVTAVNAAVMSSTKITKAENKVNSGIANKCKDGVVDVGPLFDCDDATTSNALALCVIAAGKRGACTAMEGADDIDLNCPGDAL